MLQVLKKPLIPLGIAIILLALYVIRWEKEIIIKPNAAIHNIYKTDRWTGQGWVVTYRGNNILEEPTLDNYAVSVYAESVKQRPEITSLRENRIQTAKDESAPKAPIESFSGVKSGVAVKDAVDYIPDWAAQSIKKYVQSGDLDYNTLREKVKIALRRIGFNPTESDLKEIEKIKLANKINVIEAEISKLVLTTAQTELGNKAWAKRKYYSWTWDGLFALSSLWLLVSILLKNKKPRVV